MDFAAVDDENRLYVSSTIDDWAAVERIAAHVIVDLEGGLDSGIPTGPGRILYLYFPVEDENLPDCHTLTATASYLAELYRKGNTLLLHCSMGLNRSALMACLVLHDLGWTGPAAVERLRERRPGALFNEVFCEYLMKLGLGEKGGDTRG